MLKDLRRPDEKEFGLLVAAFFGGEENFIDLSIKEANGVPEQGWFYWPFDIKGKYKLILCGVPFQGKAFCMVYATLRIFWVYEISSCRLWKCFGLIFLESSGILKNPPFLAPTKNSPGFWVEIDDLCL